MRIACLAPKPWHDEQMQTARHRIRSPQTAIELWERVFSPEERQRLGGDFDAAFLRHGTAGMFQKLHGSSLKRAIIDVAFLMGHMDAHTRTALLHRFGENQDPEQAIDKAIAAGHLVLVEDPREAFWNQVKIEINWYRYNAAWQFLWELAQHGKVGKGVDRSKFGDEANEKIVADRKNRLITHREFPAGLAEHIKSAGRATQRLVLPAEKIRILESAVGNEIREWRPYRSAERHP
jgi:hypothetical protein